MRTPAILALAIVAAPALARPDDHGSVRSVSLAEAIDRECGRYGALDREELGRIRLAFVDLGVGYLGRQGFDEAIAAERPRRRQEVAAAGAEPWCAEQRRFFRDLGNNNVFPR